MVEKKSNWEFYDYLLKNNKNYNKNRTITMAQSSFLDIIQDNPAFQENATRNGILQPMLVTRTSANECDIQVKPGDKLFIGDLVECYGEKWLVNKVFEDEYGLCSGDMWLCNYVCKFQNKDGKIFSLDGVIDDGKYTKSEKSIITSETTYNLYLPLTEETNKFYIDKRLAIGTMFDQSGKEILQVMKIEWIDKQEVNLGAGSHMLKFRLTADVYNPGKDNIENLICDYIDKSIEEDNLENIGDENSLTDGNLIIMGKDTIKIGTSRTYKIEGDNTNDMKFNWEVDKPSINLTPKENSCKVTIPLDDNLIGEVFTLIASDETGIKISKKVEVITIG